MFRFGKDKLYMEAGEACTFEGVHVDLWWSGKEAAMKRKITAEMATTVKAQPLTVVGIAAPKMRPDTKFYSWELLGWLTECMSFVYQVGKRLEPPHTMSGLLGGGAYRGNRPLILLLHLILQPPKMNTILEFHYPIFESYGDPTLQPSELSQRVVERADKMLQQLIDRNATTMEEALSNDADLLVALSFEQSLDIRDLLSAF